MMSARGDALDVVSGLEAGADDYVVKPVDTSVLVARIRSLLRRASFRPVSEHPTEPVPGVATDLVFGDLTIDPQGLEVRRAGVALAPTELRLLLEFAANPGIVLDRRTLLRDVWDYGWDGDSRVVDLRTAPAQEGRRRPDRDGPRFRLQAAALTWDTPSRKGYVGC